MRQIDHPGRRDADLEAVDLALELAGDILATLGVGWGDRAIDASRAKPIAQIVHRSSVRFHRGMPPRSRHARA